MRAPASAKDTIAQNRNAKGDVFNIKCLVIEVCRSPPPACLQGGEQLGVTRRLSCVCRPAVLRRCA